MLSLTSRGGLQVLAASCAALGLSAACMQPDPQSPKVFGGQGAASLDEKPLPAGAGDPAALGPCGKSGPASSAALLDDFEDGDGRLFKAFERDGFWFGAGDKTAAFRNFPSGPSLC